LHKIRKINATPTTVVLESNINLIIQQLKQNTVTVAMLELERILGFDVVASAYLDLNSACVGPPES
jgi:hypothetical protein